MFFVRGEILGTHPCFLIEVGQIGCALALRTSVDLLVAFGAIAGFLLRSNPLLQKLRTARFWASCSDHSNHLL